VFLSFSYSGAQSATAKFTESVCFANFAIFHAYLIQIYFESKYSKKLRFLDSNTEGLESIGFDIPLYAPNRRHHQRIYCILRYVHLKKQIFWNTLHQKNSCDVYFITAR